MNNNWQMTNTPNGQPMNNNWQIPNQLNGQPTNNGWNNGSQGQLTGNGWNNGQQNMSRKDAWDAQYKQNHWTNQQGQANSQQVPLQEQSSGQMKQGNPYQNGVYQGPQGIFSGVPTQNIERPAQKVEFTPYTQPLQDAVNEPVPQQKSVNEPISVESEIDEQPNQEITEDVKELNTQVSDVEIEEKAEPVAEEEQDTESAEFIAEEEQDTEIAEADEEQGVECEEKRSA